jgi:hypothetical protein
MAAREALLATFLPSEWNEKAYANGPPFTMEDELGRVYLVPRDRDAEAKLSGISLSLGMKKARGRPGYIVSRADAVKAIREFEWFTRRSKRHSDLAVLWALVHIGEERRWTLADISLQEVAETAGLSLKECGDCLRKIFRLGVESGAAKLIAECAADRHMVEFTLKKRIEELPTWTEEAVMAALCSDPGMSVAEIHERVMNSGVGVGAIYKVVERLKLQGYVYPAKYFRVSERGPMREMLTADCRRCFYGFADQDACLHDTLRQLQLIFLQHGKSPTQEELSALYASMRSIPYSSRTNRKVLTSLKLMREVDRMMSDKRVMKVLKRIEEHCGIELSTKTPRERPR